MMGSNQHIDHILYNLSEKTKMSEIYNEMMYSLDIQSPGNFSCENQSFTQEEKNGKIEKLKKKTDKKSKKSKKNYKM